MSHCAFLYVSDKMKADTQLPSGSSPSTFPPSYSAMAVAPVDAQEKSPIGEKSSYDQHDSKSSDVDVHAQSLSYKEAGVSGKPKLPYRWQFAIIILTCLCTCKYLVLCLTGLADS